MTLRGRSPHDCDRGSTSNSTRKYDFGRGLLYVIAVVVLLVIVVPLSFSIIGGFRSNAQLAADPVALPNPWVFTQLSDGAHRPELLRVGEEQRV